MAVFVKYHSAAQDLGRKVHNLHADTLRILLSNTAPNAAAHAVKADAGEIAAGAGYAAGGPALAAQNYAHTGGTGRLTATTPLVITAAGGSIGPFQYAILYNSTAANGPLIGYWDYGSPVTLADGERLEIAFTGGLLLTV